MKNTALILLFLILLITTTIFAQKNTIWTDANNLALRGYDTVEYFISGKAVKGSSKYQIKWKGAIWRFKSSSNLNKFKNNKNNYVPQYGGYCSSAVANGYTAPTDPHSWKIVDGKLYLNYNKSVHKKWLKDYKNNIKKADKNWPDVLK